MDERLIGDGLRQRVLEGLQQEPYMHRHDLNALRRFVSACFAVLRRNCTWADLACFVTSAEAAKKRFRRWIKKRFRRWARRFCYAKCREGRVGPAAGALAAGCRAGRAAHRQHRRFLKAKR